MNQSEKIEFLKTVRSYIRGELSRVEIDELWQLFLKNPETFELFETELHLQSLLRERNSSENRIYPFDHTDSDHDGSEGFKSYRMWVLSAAAVILIAIGIQFFSVSGEQTPAELAITNIDSSNLIGAELLRSDEEEAVPINVMINQAVAKAYEGDNEEAIRLLEEALMMGPEDEAMVLTELNLGVLYYNTGEYRLSAESFKKVVESEGQPDHRYEKAWWFMGNAYLNLGELEQARDAVFNAYTLNGRFNKPALALLKKIDLRLGGEPALQAPQQLGR